MYNDCRRAAPDPSGAFRTAVERAGAVAAEAERAGAGDGGHDAPWPTALPGARAAASPR